MASIKLLEEINIRDENKEELLPGMASDFTETGPFPPVPEGSSMPTSCIRPV